jgi:hypothetical protein
VGWANGRAFGPKNLLRRLPAAPNSPLTRHRRFRYTVDMDDASQPKPRWYRLTPDRLILGLLAVEAFLLLSQWGGWFPFNQHKGWTVLIAVAVVGVTAVLLLIWLAASLLFRWRFQYSLRSLLVLIAAVAFACSWLTTEMQLAKTQRGVVAAVEAAGGDVGYAVTETPDWLLELFGHDLFSDVWHGTARTDAQATRLYGLSQIVWLTLNGPGITDVTLEHLQRFSKLRLLYLHGANVTDAGLKHLETLPELETLDLSETRISDSGLGYLHPLKRLSGLSLSNTGITDAGLAQLTCWPHLQRLNLDSTKITDSGLKYIESSPHLKVLAMSSTKVTDSGLAHLQKCLQLERLCLSETDLTDLGLRRLQALPNLKILRLAGVRKITSAGLAHLAVLRRLNWIEVQGTAVTKDGVDKLQEALPDCTVTYGSTGSSIVAGPSR